MKIEYGKTQQEQIVKQSNTSSKLLCPSQNVYHLINPHSKDQEMNIVYW